LINYNYLLNPKCKTFKNSSGAALLPCATRIDGKVTSTSSYGLRMMKEQRNRLLLRKNTGSKPTAVPVADWLQLAGFSYIKIKPNQRFVNFQVECDLSLLLRKGGHSEDISNWGKTGPNGLGETVNYSLFGRNSSSGTYGYFKRARAF